MTDDELRILVERGLIGPEEKSAIRQAELAKGLRASEFAKKGKNDLGSNIGRAAMGIAGGLSDYRSGLADQAGLTARQGQQMQLANLMRAGQFADLAKQQQAQAKASGVSGAVTPGMGTDDYEDDLNRWRSAAYE